MSAVATAALAETAASPAFTGEIDALFEMMRYPDLGQLRERIAVFKRVPRNYSGYPTVRPSDCMAITGALRQFYTTHQRRFVTGDTYLTGHFLAMIEEFRKSDISFYPNEVFRLDLVKAEALIACGREGEAIDICEPFAQRPYLVEDDYGMLVNVMEVDTLARLSAGRLHELRNVSLGRARLMTNWQRRDARGVFLRMAGVLALGSDTSSSWTDGIIRFMALLVLWMRRFEARHKYLRFIIRFSGPEFVVSSIAAFLLLLTHRRWFGSQVQIRHASDGAGATPPLQKAVPENRQGFLKTFEKPILVSRAMGGLGDVAMMTPGVNVLAKRYKRPVYFATKKAFFPLFENNPDVRLIDIDSYFDISQFRRWYNLSNCPASRYEVIHAPMIKKSRVETFARGMAVGYWALRRFGMRPIVPLSAEQKEVAARFRAQYASPDRPLIGIQPYSRDTYKNCDAIFDAARKLSEKYRVVFMHTTPLPIEESENIIVLTGRPLREILAITSVMDYYMSVDSAFYHLTAAFDVPTLGIFGPTSGKTLSRHHVRFRLVTQRVPFPCAPCWRNEDSPCVLTHNNRSACLTSITAEQLCEEFEGLAKTYPVKKNR